MRCRERQGGVGVAAREAREHAAEPGSLDIHAYGETTFGHAAFALGRRGRAKPRAECCNPVGIEREGQVFLIGKLNLLPRGLILFLVWALGFRHDPVHVMGLPFL